MRNWQTDELDLTGGASTQERCSDGPVPSPSDLVSISCKLLKQSNAAVYVADAFQEFWLPKSQITIGDADPITGTLEIKVPMWLAVQKGLC